MAAPPLAGQALRNFPESLNGMPFLLPEFGSAMRDLLEVWFQSVGVRPRIVAEFGDSALMKSFGQEGAGLFAVPTSVRAVVESTYRVVNVHEMPNIKEQIYAVVMPARKSNPAVTAILNAVH